MTPEIAKKPTLTEVGFERAYEMLKEMTNLTEYDLKQAKVCTGSHPDFGAIHLVIPPIGNPFVLPLVIQNFAL